LLCVLELHGCNKLLSQPGHIQLEVQVKQTEFSFNRVLANNNLSRMCQQQMAAPRSQGCTTTAAVLTGVSASAPFFQVTQVSRAIDIWTGISTPGSIC
jgi:hypothetical protein